MKLNAPKKSGGKHEFAGCAKTGDISRGRPTSRREVKLPSGFVATSLQVCVTAAQRVAGLSLFGRTAKCLVQPNQATCIPRQFQPLTAVRQTRSWGACRGATPNQVDAGWGTVASDCSQIPSDQDDGSTLPGAMIGVELHYTTSNNIRTITGIRGVCKALKYASDSDPIDDGRSYPPADQDE